MDLECGDLPVSLYSAVVSSVELSNAGICVSLCFSLYSDDGLGGLDELCASPDGACGVSSVANDLPEL